MSESATPRVAVLMGSATDWETMKRTSDTLKKFGVAHECHVISAHRQPDRLAEYCKTAEERGIELFICAAGGAAHLAGVTAALTHLPVLACPMAAWSLDGLDSLLSMVQMPKGVPVATFAIGSHGAINAAIFAVQMLALNDQALRAKLLAFRKEQSEQVSELPQD